MDVKALQNDEEIARFAEIVRQSGAKSYLEIGAKFGGSLWRIANAMPEGSRVVSVDMPAGTKAWPESRKSLERAVTELCRKGYDAHIVWGDSTAPDTVAKVRSLGPFDCVFIDGNHTMPYVRKDWTNYGKDAQKIVAFHDIGWKRAPDAGITYSRIDVPEFWNEIKSQFRHEEINLEPKDNGIGVIFR